MFTALTASHRIGRYFGIEVRITYLLYLVVALFTLSDLSRFGVADGLITLTSLLCLIGFVYLHEMGHSLAAMKEGVGVQAIYLHPLGGLARLSGMLPGPLAEIAVALAGPFVNLLLAAVFFLPMYLLYGAVARGTLPGNFFFLNLMLALFNLLPIFPMDGGRVVTAILVMKYGPQKAIAMSGKIARTGFILLGFGGAVLLLTGGGLQGIVLIILAVFLYRFGADEMQARAYVAGYAYGWGAGAIPAISSEESNGEEWKRQPEKIKVGWLARRQQKQAAMKASREKKLRKQVDEILRKVNAKGLNALTKKERKLLTQAGEKMKKS